MSLNLVREQRFRRMIIIVIYAVNPQKYITIIRARARTHTHTHTRAAVTAAHLYVGIILVVTV